MDADALIDALGEEFLESIPRPNRPMAPFRWVGGEGEPGPLDSPLPPQGPHLR